MSVLTPLALLQSNDSKTTCNLTYLRNVLGRRNYGDRRMCTYVRELIAKHGFPPPLPTLVGETTTGEVVPDSNWIRASVDSWLFDFPPPARAAAIHEAAGRHAVSLRMVAGGAA